MVTRRDFFENDVDGLQPDWHWEPVIYYIAQTAFT